MKDGKKIVRNFDRSRQIFNQESTSHETDYFCHKGVQS